MAREATISGPVRLLFVGVALAAAGLVAAPANAAEAERDTAVTFAKDVAPILQRSCQNCHRPDSVAPMSLLTYEEARPWARAIKDKTALREMPPWFIDKTIGIQHYKDDISLSDEEIAVMAAWADNGAPRGNPSDLPAPLEFPAEGVWTIGEPDLIVSTPTMTVPAVAADYHDEYGPVPTGLTVDRYLKAVEVHEVRLLDDSAQARLRRQANEGSGYGRFTIHHMGIHTGDEYYASEEGRSQFRLTHEIGQNATTYPEDVGVVLPANSELKFTVHLYASGEVVPLRADIGFVFHPEGYKPKYDSWEFGAIGGIGDGLDIPADQDSVRLDGYYIMPQPGLLNTFEPHMHASGRRMCVEAIYPPDADTHNYRLSPRREVLSCADYDHNWAKVYVYQDDYAPLLPKGAVLHLTGWYDNTTKNRNVVEPRNWKGHGERSIDDMFVQLAKFTFLSNEQYAEIAADREAKRQNQHSDNQD